MGIMFTDFVASAIDAGCATPKDALMEIWKENAHGCHF